MSSSNGNGVSPVQTEAGARPGSGLGPSGTAELRCCFAALADAAEWAHTLLPEQLSMASTHSVKQEVQHSIKVQGLASKLTWTAWQAPASKQHDPAHVQPGSTAHLKSAAPAKGAAASPSAPAAGITSSPAAREASPYVSPVAPGSQTDAPAQYAGATSLPAVHSGQPAQSPADPTASGSPGHKKRSHVQVMPAVVSVEHTRTAHHLNKGQIPTHHAFLGGAA